MKIVCLTENSPGLRYTVNVIHRRFGVTLVVLEAAKQGLFWRDLRRFGIVETLYRVRLVGRRLLPTGRSAAINDRVFGTDWRRLDAAIPALRTADVNSGEIREAIARIRPTVVVCQGTSLVRDATVDGVGCSLNIHTGLSPYYRGSRCTEWALAVGDVLNIGVTVHRLTSEIDGGEILGQSRIAVEPEDDVDSLNARAIAAGTDIVVDALSRLAAGDRLQFRPQPRGAGRLFYRRQWSRHIDKHLRHLLRRGELAAMVRNPSAPPRPLLAPWAGEREAPEAQEDEAARCRSLAKS